MERQLLHELKHLNNMSSPFAQKFMSKKPFTQNKDINPEAGGKDYEAIGDAARKREKKLSAETGGTDYEAKLQVQKELSNLSPLNRYVSIEPAMQRLQKDAENIAAMDKKESTTGYDSSKSFGKNLEASNKKSGLTSNFDTKSGKFDFGEINLSPNLGYDPSMMGTASKTKKD
jgi:hypothetical protein